MKGVEFIWFAILFTVNIILTNCQPSDGGEGGSGGGGEGGSGGGGSGGSGGGSTDDRPNIVFMFADDLGWNDVVYNGATDCYTPVMDDLASSGVVLSYFYTYPKCAPSRAALLTGRYPLRYGFQHDAATSHTIECGLNLTETLISDVLQNDGYETYMLGKWHLGFYQWDYTPNYRGFDTFAGFYGNQEDYYLYNYAQNDMDGIDFRENTDPYNASTTGDYGPDLYADYMDTWLDDIIGDTSKQPFFWYIAHQSPHTPISTRTKYVKSVNTVRNYTSNNRKNYCSLVYAMDESIGTIRDTLKENDLWNNTYFMFFSDNGPSAGLGSAYPLRGAKGSYFEGGIRVPAIISGGLIPESMRGTELTESTSLIDLFSTICSMAEIDCSDYNVDGVDLLDYVLGTQSSLGRDYLLLGVDNVQCKTDEDVCGVIRYGDLKLALGKELIGGGDEDYYWDALNNPDAPDSPTVDCGSGTQPAVNYSDLSWDCGYNDDICLFNISADPCEYNDLSGDSAYSSIITDMLAELESYYNIQKTALQLACNYSGSDGDANPANHDGYWSPWSPSPTGADGTDWENSGGSGGTGTGGTSTGGGGGGSSGPATTGDGSGVGSSDSGSVIMAHIALVIGIISSFLLFL